MDGTDSWFVNSNWRKNYKMITLKKVLDADKVEQKHSFTKKVIKVSNMTITTEKDAIINPPTGNNHHYILNKIFIKASIFNFNGF